MKNSRRNRDRIAQPAPTPKPALSKFEMKRRGVAPPCVGSWRDCPNAKHVHENGWPVMRCMITGAHPDDCVK